MKQKENPAEGGGIRFDKTTFETGFDQLFEDWQSKWVKIGMATAGPFRYIGIAKPYLSPEQIEANRPEMEAYEKFLDYCVTHLLSGLATGDHHEVFESIRTQFGARLTGGQSKILTDFYEDLMKRLLDRVAEKS